MDIDVRIILLQIIMNLNKTFKTFEHSIHHEYTYITQVL